MKRILLFLLLLAAGRLAAQQVTAAEYFFDTDPGVGLATSIAVTPGTTLDESLSVSTAGLLPGVHWLYVRSYRVDAGNNGAWSLAEPRRFVVSGPVVAAEYFFDADPGVGNGTALAITPGASLNESAAISVTGLPTGRHVLYLRTQNSNGSWSLSEARSFFINESLVAAEYFIDTDPGNGLATPIAVTPGASFDISLSLPSGVLPAGSHRLYVRTQSSSGAWSFVETRNFFVQEQIVAAEYFFDNDPGLGAGTALTVPTGTSLNESPAIAMTGLGGGAHDLFVRTRSNSGAWSIVEKRRFYVKPTVVAGEFFVETDPGPGKAYPIAFAPAENVDQAATLLLPPCLSAGTRQLSVRTRDEYGQWGIAEGMTVQVPVLNPGIVQQTLVNNTTYCQEGQAYSFYEPGTSRLVARATTAGTLSNISTNVFVEAAPFTAYERPFLQRHFLLRATNANNDPVTVRLFFTAAEYNTLTAYSPLITSPARLAVYQYEGPNEDNVLDISDATYQSTIYPSAWGQEYGGYWLEFTVTHFSEFWVTLSGGYALPAVGLRLEGTTAGSGNELRWRTLTQSNTSHFLVERSANGADWEAIGRLAAAGNSTAELRYQYTDNSAGSRAWYYRIRLVDLDSRNSWSNTVLLRRGALKGWTLAPNPVRDRALVTGPATEGVIAWRIIDMGGRSVGAGQWQAVPGGAYELPVSKLPAGSYRLLLQGASGPQELPFLKQ